MLPDQLVVNKIFTLFVNVAFLHDGYSANMLLDSAHYLNLLLGVRRVRNLAAAGRVIAW